MNMSIKGGLNDIICSVVVFGYRPLISGGVAIGGLVMVEQGGDVGKSYSHMDIVGGD